MELFGVALWLLMVLGAVLGGLVVSDALRVWIAFLHLAILGIVLSWGAVSSAWWAWVVELDALCWIHLQPAWNLVPDCHLP